MTEGWLIVRIAEKWPDSEDTFGLTLMSVDGSALPTFAAGDHIDVRIADGLVRQYSLFGSPRNLTQYRICVQRASPSRGGSAFIADNFRAGDLIRISRPRSCFLIAEDAAFHVLVAGGIGITPIIAMAEQLILDGKSFHLHYCCRSRARTPLLGLLEEERFTGRFDLHLSEGPSASRLDLDRLVAQSPPGSHIYVCGPHRLIEAACGAAKSRGWDAARVHHEEFSPTPATHYGEAFRIRLARSGAGTRCSPGKFHRRGPPQQRRERRAELRAGPVRDLCRQGAGGHSRPQGRIPQHIGKGIQCHNAGVLLPFQDLDPSAGLLVTWNRSSIYYRLSASVIGGIDGEGCSARAPDDGAGIV